MKQQSKTIQKKAFIGIFRRFYMCSCVCSGVCRYSGGLHAAPDRQRAPFDGRGRK